VVEYVVRLRKHPLHFKQNLFIEHPAKRKIIRAGRRFGKTVLAARIAVEDFLTGRRVLYAAPTAEQTTKFWAEVNYCLSEPIKAGVYRKNESERYVERVGTEQRIRAKTAWNVDTLRGDYADRLILDEWQLMNEDCWEIVGQPMLADYDGDAVFIFTPPSLRSRSVMKAKDPRHASKMFKDAVAKMKVAEALGKTPLWFAMWGSTYDNPTISQETLDEMRKEMTELAFQQEIMAEDKDEAPGALWKRTTIEKARVTKVRDLARIVIGVDPPGGATECGIVGVGVALCDCKGYAERHAFVLEDSSLAAPPDQWAAEVDHMYRRLNADCVVGENNFGGDMVEHTIRTANVNISYKNVHASRGKAVRAEPIAALYEQGKVHHVGPFPYLEDEQCLWIPGTTKNSPNRLDAEVWAITELLLSSGELRF